MPMAARGRWLLLWSRQASSSPLALVTVMSPAYWLENLVRAVPLVRSTCPLSWGVPAGGRRSLAHSPSNSARNSPPPWTWMAATCMEVEQGLRGVSGDEAAAE